MTCGLCTNCRKFEKSFHWQLFFLFRMWPRGDFLILHFPLVIFPFHFLHPLGNFLFDLCMWKFLGFSGCLIAVACYENFPLRHYFCTIFLLTSLAFGVCCLFSALLRLTPPKSSHHNSPRLNCVLMKVLSYVGNTCCQNFRLFKLEFFSGTNISIIEWVRLN